MVEKANFEGNKVFKCMKCGWFYKSLEIAQKCEDWCKKHNSCNLNLTNQAIKIKFA